MGKLADYASELRRLGLTRERVRRIEAEALERLAVQRRLEALLAA